MDRYGLVRNGSKCFPNTKRYGTVRNGSVWNGMERNGLVRNGSKCVPNTKRYGMDRNGSVWNGMDWYGMDPNVFQIQNDGFRVESPSLPYCLAVVASFTSKIQGGPENMRPGDFFT